MTKHTFSYDHLCDLLYFTNPADFEKELNRLGLPEKKLRSLLKRHAREQRKRIKEIEVEQGRSSSRQRRSNCALGSRQRFAILTNWGRGSASAPFQPNVSQENVTFETSTRLSTGITTSGTHPTPRQLYCELTFETNAACPVVCIGKYLDSKGVRL